MTAGAPPTPANEPLPPAAGDGIADDTAAIQAGAPIRPGASLPPDDVLRCPKCGFPTGPQVTGLPCPNPNPEPRCGWTFTETRVDLPSDVQRPTPPLTDEELAMIESGAWGHDDLRRLIADLRAKNERVKELEAELFFRNREPK